MATAVALIVSPICRVHLQWVPFRCGVDSNEDTDTVAKEAAALPQVRVPADVRTGPPTARPPERPVAVGDRSSLSVKYAPAPRRPLVRVGSQQYLCRIGKTPPRNASSAQTIPALRAGVSRVVRRKAPCVASFFGARPLGELWDGAFCGSAPSFAVRMRTVISEVAQFITCCKCKTFLELHSY